MNSLSRHASEMLDEIGRTETSETEESIRKLFVDSGVPPFNPIIQAFLSFGGYCLPFEREGRFKIARAKAAARMLRSHGDASNDPSRFRMPFGESETVQSHYTIDGHGHLYEDGVQIARSLSEWVEAWAKRARV